ncbi:DUF6348 family protein [Streptomyces sp. NPDC020794]|uniref:DUF6348 family protein n=1 Tax=unclassified Streptomyces TaxID=2593676 RepID=UPI0036EEE1A9
MSGSRRRTARRVPQLPQIVQQQQRRQTLCIIEKQHTRLSRRPHQSLAGRPGTVRQRPRRQPQCLAQRDPQLRQTGPTPTFARLLDRRQYFADHAGPDDERGVPGWYCIASGAVGLGVDAEESRRLQNSLVDANVLHHIADTFTADLESPFFNGIKVFCGGQPGKVQAEIRVTGERHEAASAALDLPEPNAFTMVRAYALLLPMPEDGTEPPYPPARLDLAHTRACGSGNQPA